MENAGAKLLGGKALQSTGTATSIRGGADVTDGPFVETKEVLGGYYLVDAPTSTPPSPSASCARPASAASRCGRSMTFE